MRLFDAHNHLQDERLAPYLGQIVSAPPAACVVNGSTESDWSSVLDLARRYEWIVPSYGYHPWYVSEASSDWETSLAAHLEAMPSAVGEIGLDRWRHGFDDALQEKLFRRQMEIAADRDIPASIHCLKAFGRLLEILTEGPVPKCGFLLHSYGGPSEMVPAFARLGAYFSFPGYFLGSGKERKQAAFRAVPHDRLLVETDAPDQCLPAEFERFALSDLADSGRRVNDPRNLEAVYAGVAEITGVHVDLLSEQVGQNFLTLFGRLTRSVSTSPAPTLR